MKKTAINKLLLCDKEPKICIPVSGDTREGLLAGIRNAASAGADLCEWRADCFRNVLNKAEREDALAEMKGILSDIPLLFTFRTAEEGGSMDISPREYAELAEWAGNRQEIDLVDIEALHDGIPAERIIARLHEKKKTVIASCHFFDRTPSDEEMVMVLQKEEEAGGDILKLAVMPQSPEDVLRLMAVTEKMNRESKKLLLTMAMGRTGVVSRISGSLTGSCITFGTAGNASAPGQLPAETLRGILEALR